MKQLITDFINSGDTVLKFDTIVPVRHIESILKDHGFEPLELTGDETNGWQVDFWYTFVHPEKGAYTYSGSLHYGEAKLSKD